MNHTSQRTIFNDPKLALDAIQCIRWSAGPTCIRCGSKAVRQTSKPHNFRCRSCSQSFSVTTGTALAQIPLPPHVWLLGVYILSSNRYRASAFLKIEREANVPAQLVEAIWEEVRCRCRKYKGYKKNFGKLIQAEMTVKSPRLFGYNRIKAQLIAAGEHQSQNTINSTGALLAWTSLASAQDLKRTECLLRLILTVKP